MSSTLKLEPCIVRLALLVTAPLHSTFSFRALKEAATALTQDTHNALPLGLRLSRAREWCVGLEERLERETRKCSKG